MDHFDAAERAVGVLLGGDWLLSGHTSTRFHFQPLTPNQARLNYHLLSGSSSLHCLRVISCALDII